MILRSPAKDENDPHANLSRQDCHPERSEGSALKRPTTGDRRPRKKQILRRCAPQNDTGRVSGKGNFTLSLQFSIFEGGMEDAEGRPAGRRYYATFAFFAVK